jgi:uncharacterized protein involved in exopolysaccharide biosynthesis
MISPSVTSITNAEVVVLDETRRFESVSRNDWADTDSGRVSAFRQSTLDLRLESNFEPRPEARRGSLREALTAAFHDRRRIAYAFLIPLFLTILITFIPTPKYTSDATLLLRLGREYLYTPETGASNAAAPMAYDRELTMRAEVEILTSRDVKDAVLTRMGVETMYPNIANGESDPLKRHDKALIQFGKNLDATLLKDSNVVHLAFTNPDPQVAAKVLNTVISVYLDRRRSIFNTASTADSETHVASLRARLVDTESKLDELKRQNQIQSFVQEQSLLLAQRQTIDMRLDDSSLVLAQSTGRAGALKASLLGTQTDVTLSNETQRGEAVEGARKALLDLRLKERDLTSRLGNSHPLVIGVRADMQRTETFLKDFSADPARTVRTGRSTVRDGVESELVRSLADQVQASASRTALMTQRDEVLSRLNRLAGSQRQLESLERDHKLLEGALESASRKLEDEIVNQRLDQSRKSNVSVVQAAREPLEPRSIRGIVFIAGLLFSVLTALLVAFISAMWRDTFISPEDVQSRLGLPLLAAVPQISAT